MSSASCEIFTSLSKIVKPSISGQCEIFRNNSSGTTKNRKQEIGHPCRTPLNMGNLVGIKNNRATYVLTEHDNGINKIISKTKSFNGLHNERMFNRVKYLMKIKKY